MKVLVDEKGRPRDVTVANSSDFARLDQAATDVGSYWFTGLSGSGKSSLIDAVSAVLVPGGKVRFNAAAQDAGSARGDRSVFSYVRGAWRRSSDADTGEVSADFAQYHIEIERLAHRLGVAGDVVYSGSRPRSEFASMMRGAKLLLQGELAEAELPVNRWIIGEVVETLGKLNRAFDELRFDGMADAIYHFTWGTFCDWYVELVKGAFDEETKRVAAWAFDQILVMLHPFMPFVTEELWNANERPYELIVAKWPAPEAQKQLVLVAKSARLESVASFEELAGQLQGTLGATMEGQPGVAERSFGPGPSRPGRGRRDARPRGARAPGRRDDGVRCCSCS